MFFFKCMLATFLGVSFLFGTAAGATSEKHGEAGRIHHIYEGSMTWTCWGDRQKISLVLGHEVQAGQDLVRLKGFEVYAVGARYRLIEIDLDIDVAQRRFSLREHIADDTGGDVAVWGKVHEGIVSEDFETLVSGVGEDQATCAPRLELTAVHPPVAQGGAQR